MLSGRIKVRLTPAQLAERTALTQQYVSLVEAGHQNITIDTMAAVARVIGRDVSTLLRKERNPIVCAGFGKRRTQMSIPITARFGGVVLLTAVLFGAGVVLFATAAYASNVHLKPPHSSPSFTDNGITLTAGGALAGLGSEDGTAGNNQRN